MVESMDASGTRGTTSAVSTLAAQMSEVLKDVGQVGAELERFRSEHERLHEREHAARVVSRRWLVATGIAAFVALETPVFYIVSHVR